MIASFSFRIMREVEAIADRRDWTVTNALDSQVFGTSHYTAQAQHA